MPKGRRRVIVAALVPVRPGRGVAAAWPRAGRIDAPPPWSGLVKATRAPLLSESRGCLTRGDGRGNMPASDTFARLGLVAAVTVVVGISTLGPLLRQGPQPEGKLVALAAVVPPAPSFARGDRSTGVADPARDDRLTGMAVAAPSTRAAAASPPVKT